MHRRLSLALIVFCALSGIAPASAERISGLSTNQDYVEAVNANARLDIARPKSVFAAILNTLPDRVRVYPTESYYYFSFFHNGERYAGNIRLDIQARRRGRIYFTYFRAATQQHPDGAGQRALLGKTDGVDVQEVKPLEWKVSYAGKSVVFVLNDLSGVKPPPSVLSKTERFIGPVFDESGVRFFLVFDERRAEFLFILDETTQVADALQASEASAELLLGRRTGFLFYADRAHGERKVLVGVFGHNTELNNYFDGPFDQLPDNFIVGDSLREAIIKRQPEMKGRIDRFGNLEDGENRVLISPYATYYAPDDLERIAQCIKITGLPVTDACIPPPDNSAGGDQASR